MNVRPARPEELEAIPNLWAAVGLGLRSGDTGGSLQGLLRNDAGALLIAEEDGRVVGTIIAAWDGWRGNLYRLGVLPELRRRGIARELVAAAERHIRGLGGTRIVAAVGQENVSAVEFWRAAGYAIQDVHRMVKDLP